MAKNSDPQQNYRTIRGNPNTLSVPGQVGDLMIDTSTGLLYSYDGTTPWAQTVPYGDVAQNSSDIAQNSSDIAQNSSDIAQSAITGIPFTASLSGVVTANIGEILLYDTTGGAGQITLPAVQANVLLSIKQVAGAAATAVVSAAPGEQVESVGGALGATAVFGGANAFTWLMQGDSNPATPAWRIVSRV